MSEEQLAGRLTELGIAPDEARAYVQLHQDGAAGATEVALALRMSRAGAYRALEALTRHGFATVRVGRPRRFSAANLDVVLAALRSGAATRLRQLDAAEAELAPIFDRIRKPRQAHAKPHFTMVRGAEAMAAQSHELLANAGNQVAVLITAQGGRDLIPTPAHSSLLAERARRGVQVRVLLAEEPGSARAWRDPPAGVDVRSVAAAALASCMVADAAEAMVILDSSGRKGAHSGGGMAFRTDSPPCVAMQHELLERLWASGTAVRKR